MNPRKLSIPLVLICAPVLSGAPAWVGESGSPLVRLFADSPVEWMPWSAETFDRAAENDKPVFLHVGSFSSELSRAMAEQTFSNPATAKILNDEFVCVLVDRAEQPGVADLHQAYLREEKQVSGWPVNIWLTPEMKPIEGTAYLPPSEEWGQPGFINVLDRTLSAWKSDPEGQRSRAESVAEAIGGKDEWASEPTDLDKNAIAEILAMGIESWTAGYNGETHVLGDPPQYLEPDVLRVFLADEKTGAMAVAILTAILNGGVHDHIGGGFFKQAIGDSWTFPQFQKSLTDQAAMVHALLDAAKLTGDQRFATAAAGALEFVLRDMGNPSSGFVSALDAGAPGKVVSFFWTADEIETALGKKDGVAFCEAYGITADGNIAPDTYLGVETAGKNVPFLTADRDAAATKIDRSKLVAARAQRPTPLKDAIATSGAHGLLLGALARAGGELKNEAFTAAAKNLLGFIKSEMTADENLLRLKGGKIHASPLDVALVVDGLIQFTAATGDDSAQEWALKLQSRLDERYLDADSGRYFVSTGEVSPGIWARAHVPGPGKGETASVEAVAALNWIRLGKPENAAPLAQSIAVDIEESYDPPRGGDLVALQMVSPK